MASNFLETGEKLTQLQPGKVKFLMKSAPNPGAISTEAVMVATMSAELFLEKLIKGSREKGRKRMDKSLKGIVYEDVANYVQETEMCEFLQDIVPHKMGAKEAVALQETRQEETTEND